MTLAMPGMARAGAGVLLLSSRIGLIYVGLMNLLGLDPPHPLRGPGNQVLAVLIWKMWDEGEMQAVGAPGVLKILLLLLAMPAFRAFGFGSGRHIQGAR